MHINGDGGGGCVAQIVFDRVCDGVGPGFSRGLITYGVPGDEHQALECGLVDLQVVLQFYCGPVRVSHMVEHVYGHDAAGPHLRCDILGFRYGVRSGQCGRLQDDYAGRRSGCVGHGVCQLHRFGRHLASGDVDSLVAHNTGFDAAVRVRGDAGY